MELHFYYVKNEYIEFLKEYERRYNDYTCVPNVQYKTSDKFMFGAVLEMNGMSYFVPVSSFSKPREDVILIRDKKNRSEILGSLRFAYMLPIPRACLNKLDINSVKNEYSKTHIAKELSFCRRERDKIFKQANKTYTKHHLKYGKNQADNLAYIGFRRRFFPVFYWCLVLLQSNQQGQRTAC